MALYAVTTHPTDSYAISDDHVLMLERASETVLPANVKRADELDFN